MPSRPASSSLPATGSVWAMFPTYRLITGNEMGIILLDYICRTRKALGTILKRRMPLCAS